MTIPITGSTLTCLLSAALVIQLVVLATRFAAWQRYRKWQTTGEMPGDDPRLVPQTSLQAWLPVLSSGYGALVMAGGLLAYQIAPANVATEMMVMVVAYLPAMLADPVVLLVERSRRRK
jgi:hypothetical protein